MTSPDSEKRSRPRWLIPIIAIALILALIVVVVVCVHHPKKDHTVKDAATNSRDVNRADLPYEFNYGYWKFVLNTPVFEPEGETRPTLPQLVPHTKWTTPEPGEAIPLPLTPIFVVLEKMTLAQISSSDGPTKAINGVYAGYAHTTTGAVLAAINSEAAMLSCSHTQNEATSRFLGEAFTTPCKELDDPYVTIPLYVRIVDVKDNILGIQMVFDRTGDDTYSVDTTAVAWKNNDWVATPSRINTTTKYVPKDKLDLSQWVEWSK